MASETSHYETFAEKYGHLLPPGTRVEDDNPVRVFYPDHDERYAHLLPKRRREFPDEVYFPMVGRIKRERNRSELTREDFGRLGPDHIRFAAKDITVAEAMKTAEFYSS